MTRHDTQYEKKIQIEKEGRKMDSKSLMVMDNETMLARVNMAKFPQDLKPDEKKLLAQVAITYGFDPLMGEVTIYQGRPFVSIDGRYRAAQETGELDGVETRPANEQERKDWQIPDGDFFFRAEVYVKGASRPFVGWGRVRSVETQGGKGFKPVETNPQRMAEKRAEAQALRKAFHIPLPSVEDIGAPGTEVDYKITVEKPKAKQKTTAKKQETEEEPEPPQDAVTPENSGDAEPESIEIPEGMGTLTDMQKIVHKETGMQPADQLKELGYSRWTDVTETPKECYLRLMAANK
jgi:hypothetical protein